MSSVRYMRADKPRYGATEVAMSTRLRPKRGCAYGASASFQEERSTRGLSIVVATRANVEVPCPAGSGRPSRDSRSFRRELNGRLGRHEDDARGAGGDQPPFKRKIPFSGD